MVTRLDHPSVPASTSPSTMPTMPNVEVRAPATSKWPRRRSVSCSTMRPTSQDGEPDRHVDEHHPAPRHQLGQRAARHEADGSPGGRHGGEEADGPDPLGPFGEDGGQEGQRGGRGQRGADPLEGAGGQEHPAGDGQPAEERAHGEDGDAGQEGAAPAEEVAGPGPQEEQAAEGEQVGVEHPGELAPGEAEPLLDVREGDVDDRRVQDHHELGGQDDEQEHRGGVEQALEASGRPGAGPPTGAGRGATMS